MSRAIVAGSLAAVSRRDGKGLAEHFLSVEHVIVVDCSGSMNAPDSRGGRRRYDVAREELANLQAEFPGRIGVVAFSDDARFCPGGVPPFLGGGTDLAGALRFCKVADGTGAHVVVVSDGYPDDAEAALAVATGYASRIDTVYCGPEQDAAGPLFLRRLAGMTGGRHATADRARELADAVRPLLLGAPAGAQG